MLYITQKALLSSMFNVLLRIAKNKLHISPARIFMYVNTLKLFI